MGIFEYENSSGSAAGIKLEESTSSEKELSEKRNKIIHKNIVEKTITTRIKFNPSGTLHKTEICQY
jgi:hypothetical protein